MGTSRQEPIVDAMGVGGSIAGSHLSLQMQMSQQPRRA
jgi:hypothetical protein